MGSEDLIAAIQKGGAGAIDFDRCLATSAMMSKLARIARTLGPRGLMPNPKLGTIVEPSNISEAVRTMKAGRVEFRCVSACPCPACVAPSPLACITRSAKLERWGWGCHALLSCSTHHWSWSAEICLAALDLSRRLGDTGLLSDCACTARHTHTCKCP